MNAIDASEYMDTLVEDAENRLFRLSENFLAANWFVIFVLIGTQVNEATGISVEAQFIKRKARLLGDPRACVTLDMPAYSPKRHKKYADDVKQMLENIVQDAAKQHINVEELNTLQVCPVMLAAHPQAKYLDRILAGIHEYASEMKKLIIWQPFVLLEERLKYADNMRACLESVHKFVMNNQNCARCCLLSDTNSKGFFVEAESNLNTVVITALLQVVANKGAQESRQRLHGRIFQAFSQCEEWCFTAKNVTISLPVRALTIRRVLHVLQTFFSRGRPNQSVWENMVIPMDDYLNEKFAMLPMDGQVISTWPIFAAQTEDAVKELIGRCYVKPLGAEFTNQEESDRLRWLILQAFFTNNGSLDEIIALNDDIRKRFIARQTATCPVSRSPRLPVKYRQAYTVHYHYEEDLRKWLQTYAKRMLQKVVASEMFRTDLPRRASSLSMRITGMINDLKNKLCKHENSEIITIVHNANIINNLDQYTERWFKDFSESCVEEVSRANRSFDLMMLKLLEKPEGETMNSLLKVSYDCIKGHLENLESYMQQISAACFTDPGLVSGITSKVRECLVFPLRVIRTEIGNMEENVVIGNAENSLLSPLARSLGAQPLLTNDKSSIEILCISAPFSHTQLALCRDE